MGFNYSMLIVEVTLMYKRMDKAIYRRIRVWDLGLKMEVLRYGCIFQKCQLSKLTKSFPKIVKF